LEVQRIKLSGTFELLRVIALVLSSRGPGGSYDKEDAIPAGSSGDDRSGRSAWAGSAVANDGHGHTVYSFGHPKSIAIKRALDMARSEGWTDARLVAYAASVIGAAPAVESWTRIWIGEDLVGYGCPAYR
jgi:hypothetical protein